jgi:hypothetical protein
MGVEQPTEGAPDTRGRFFSPLRVARLLAAVALPYMAVIGFRPQIENFFGTKTFGVFGLVPLLMALSILLALMGLAQWANSTWFAEPGKLYRTDRSNDIYRFSSMGAVVPDVRNKVLTLPAGPVGIVTAAICLRGAGQVFVSFDLFVFELVLMALVYGWSAKYTGYLKDPTAGVPAV